MSLFPFIFKCFHETTKKNSKQHYINKIQNAQNKKNKENSQTWYAMCVLCMLIYYVSDREWKIK